MNKTYVLYIRLNELKKRVKKTRLTSLTVIYMLINR